MQGLSQVNFRFWHGFQSMEFSRRGVVWTEAVLDARARLIVKVGDGVLLAVLGVAYLRC